MLRGSLPALLIAALSLAGCAHDLRVSRRSVAASPAPSCSLPSELAVDCACTKPDCLLKLGYIYSEAIDVPRDDRRARGFYQRACAVGSVLGCNNLASLLVEGRGGEADARSGADLYEAACRRHSAFACSNLATLYLDGRGRAPNEALAALLFQQACKDGVARACGELGILYVRSDDIPVDVHQSISFFERACTDGDANACEALSMFAQAGSLSALETYIRGIHTSCDEGDSAACVHLQ